MLPEHPGCLALLPPPGKLYAPDGHLHRRKAGAQACRIKSSEQGLLGFTWQDELYFLSLLPLRGSFLAALVGEGWGLRPPPPPHLNFLGTYGPPLC